MFVPPKDKTSENKLTDTAFKQALNEAKSKKPIFRSHFDQMSQQQKGYFMKNGGLVTD